MIDAHVLKPEFSAILGASRSRARWNRTMHALIPVYSLYAHDSRHTQLLSQHDVVRAHIGAPEWLAETSRKQRAFWGRRALDVAIGGVVPCVGYLIGWPMALIVASLLIDVAGHWLADAIRLYARPQELIEEIGHALDGERTIATIHSLRKPWRVQGDRLQCWIRDCYSMPTGLTGARAQHLLWWFLCVGVPGIAMWAWWAGTRNKSPAGEFDDASLWLLALPLLLRPLAVVIDMFRARRGATDISWLPTTPQHGLAFVVACEVPMLVMMQIHDSGVTRDMNLLQTIGGWIFLATYLGTNVLIAGLWFRRQRRHVSLLRGFIASDREELRRRLARYNG